MTSPRKKILFLIPAFAGGVGGAERVMTTLLRYLDHKRFECHLALVHEGKAFLDSVPQEVVVHHLQVSRMRYSVPAIVKLVRTLRPQTILSTVSYLNVMVLVARPFFPRNTRVVVREAITPSTFIGKDTEHPRLWSFLYRRIYRRADKIVCLSDSMKRELAECFHLPMKNLVRIYNPLDSEMVRRSARAAGNPYQSVGPNLVTMARLRKEKGFGYLINAMALVLQKVPTARLTILGEGPDEMQLKAQVQKIGLDKKIDFLGFVQNPWTYVANADLFVLASLSEGVSNSLLEALALGTPAVVSDCVETMRELQVIEPSIVLFPIENSEAMADAIVAALIRQKVSGKTDVRPLKEFDPQYVAEQYSQLL